MSDFNIAISSTGAVEHDKPLINNDNKKVNDVSSMQAVASESETTIAKEVTPKQLADEDVQGALEEMNAFVQSMQRNLSFRIDEELGQEVISITDAETQEVIRQIPSEELVVLRKKMDDVVGILFDSKV
ncbi:flagellar protein FlaG [Psychromonas arctica]|uniref:flagellar protein FlaG n=1 Tax=Psychromonas arctica TaxID=168275 RepID=UPI000401EFAF|nr:flagellar protein FlaG [Psychromonas arctica]